MYIIKCRIILGNFIKKMNFVLLKGVNVMFNDKKFNLLVVEIVYIILCY